MEPVDLSPLHRELDQLKHKLCHCGMAGECLGCQGMEMLRVQMESVVAAASQPILLQVAQETALKDMASQFQSMAERMMADPEVRQATEQMQQRLMQDPEIRKLVEELMRRLGSPPQE